MAASWQKLLEQDHELTKRGRQDLLDTFIRIVKHCSVLEVQHCDTPMAVQETSESSDDFFNMYTKLHEETLDLAKNTKITLKSDIKITAPKDVSPPENQSDEKNESQDQEISEDICAIDYLRSSHYVKKPQQWSNVAISMLIYLLNSYYENHTYFFGNREPTIYNRLDGQVLLNCINGLQEKYEAMWGTINRFVDDSYEPDHSKHIEPAHALKIVEEFCERTDKTITNETYLSSLEKNQPLANFLLIHTCCTRDPSRKNEIAVTFKRFGQKIYGRNKGALSKQDLREANRKLFVELLDFCPVEEQKEQIVFFFLRTRERHVDDRQENSLLKYVQGKDELSQLVETLYSFATFNMGFNEGNDAALSQYLCLGFNSIPPICASIDAWLNENASSLLHLSKNMKRQKGTLQDGSMYGAKKKTYVFIKPDPTKESTCNLLDELLRGYKTFYFGENIEFSVIKRTIKNKIVTLDSIWKHVKLPSDTKYPELCKGAIIELALQKECRKTISKEWSTLQKEWLNSFDKGFLNKNRTRN